MAESYDNYEKDAPKASPAKEFTKALKIMTKYHLDLAKDALKDNPLTFARTMKKHVRSTADTEYQEKVNQTARPIWQAQGKDKPYTNRPSPDDIKDGDHVVIVFTGAAIGQQDGDFGVFTKYDEDGKPYFATKHLPENAKVVMFRYHEYKDALKFWRQIKDKDVTKHVVGHSWGSDAASTLAHNEGLGRATLIDPVKRQQTFRRNALIYQPEKTRPFRNPSDRIAFIGGRRVQKNSIKVPGDHSTSVIPAMEHYYKYIHNKNEDEE